MCFRSGLTRKDRGAELLTTVAAFLNPLSDCIRTVSPSSNSGSALQECSIALFSESLCWMVSGSRKLGYSRSGCIGMTSLVRLARFLWAGEPMSHLGVFLCAGSASWTSSPVLKHLVIMALAVCTRAGSRDSASWSCDCLERFFRYRDVLPVSGRDTDTSLKTSA